VLIADEKTGQVAAVHAGWRGTATRIVPNAIARLVDSGSRLEDLRIAMGPAIAGEVYQVSETVAAEVGLSIIPQDKAESTEAILDFLQQLPDSPILEDAHPRTSALRCAAVNAIQLEQLGISRESCDRALLHLSEPEHFFSYRRDKLKKSSGQGLLARHPTKSVIK
jgi:copper oxidase (laccase) domain-containing protein